MGDPGDDHLDDRRRNGPILVDSTAASRSGKCPERDSRR
tara:strand:- start:406 stop:522 length:117 start_codon:yes stop_codon:yes gene_type:complete